MAGGALLFDQQIVPRSIQQQLGSDLELRPLARDDHSRGHLELLSVLTVAPRLSPETYGETFDYIKSCPGTYFTIVIVQKSTDQIVGCGTIVMERKFVRSAGKIGHIEDIAVSKSMQGRKLGLRVINALEEIGCNQGCYKIILDCSKDNVRESRPDYDLEAYLTDKPAFYEKCGFKQKEYQMVRYMSEPPVSGPPSAKL